MTSRAFFLEYATAMISAAMSSAFSIGMAVLRNLDGDDRRLAFLEAFQFSEFCNAAEVGRGALAFVRRLTPRHAEFEAGVFDQPTGSLGADEGETLAWRQPLQMLLDAREIAVDGVGHSSPHDFPAARSTSMSDATRR